jgi:hypothetical protein
MLGTQVNNGRLELKEKNNILGTLNDWLIVQLPFPSPPIISVSMNSISFNVRGLGLCKGFLKKGFKAWQLVLLEKTFCCKNMI